MCSITIVQKGAQLCTGHADNHHKMTMPNLPRTSAIVLLPMLLASCKLDDIPGLGPDPRVLAKEAEAKAIGGACRHALRGLEDCYTLNPKAPKALVFAGWKDMDEYMRANKMEGAPSVLGQQSERKRSDRDEGGAAAAEPSSGRNRS